MLSWEKIDAIPGWFGFHSYALWRCLLDFQAPLKGDLFEIGVWKGRSASLLAAYCKPGEKLYLCDLELDETAVRSAFASVGAAPKDIVTLSGPSSTLPGRLDFAAMHQTVRWMHIDGEHTGAACSQDSSTISKENTEPAPGLLATSSRPPMASSRRRVMVRPRPVPSTCRRCWLPSRFSTRRRFARRCSTGHTCHRAYITLSPAQTHRAWHVPGCRRR